jgi:hypothetical protein
MIDDDKKTEEHPLVDKLFDGLIVGGKVGVELFIRGGKGTKHALERTIGLISEVGDHLEKRLEELDAPEAPSPKPRPKKRKAATAQAHNPIASENGVLSDKTFNCLDRPDEDGEIPTE